MSKLKEWAAIVIQKMFWLCPVVNNKVFSLNYYGKGYGDNGKYVCDEVIKQFPCVKIIWPIKGDCKLGEAPKNVKPVKYYSLAFFYHIATSKVWISNSRMPSYFRKRLQQYYIQMWHGSIALKQVEADAGNSLIPGYIQGAKNDSEMADLFISNSKYWSEIIRKSFWYEGPILECGVPRLDVLYRPNVNKENLKRKLGINENRVLLYAPTFRADMSIDSYNIDYLRLKQALRDSTGEDWYVCVRLHPSVVGTGVKLPSIEGVSDFSLYPDMYELMLVANLMITDYSSTMFEAAFSGIPVVLFATDIDEYNKDRKFYFNIRELPFPLAETNDELIDEVLSWDDELYKKRVRAFRDSLGVVEGGTASMQVAIEIIKHLNT